MPNFMKIQRGQDFFLLIWDGMTSNPYHSITNQLFEKHLYNQVATMKNTDHFHYKGNPSCAAAKSTPFTVSKDEFDTKEDTGKSMKNALYVLRYAKRHMFG